MANDPKTSSVLYEAISQSKPVQSYKKTILGRVYITVLNPFSGQPEGVILSGDPAKDDGAIYDVWSDAEKIFFEKMNKRMLETGTVIRFDRKEDVKEEKKIETYSDEELTDIINSPYMTLRSVVRKAKTVPVLYRLLTIAREQEKSEKIISLIENRISEVQDESYAPKE